MHVLIVLGTIFCLVVSGCSDNGGKSGAVRSPTPTETATTTPPPATATSTLPPTQNPTSTFTPTPTPVVGPVAVARQITDSAELIGGPLAVGRVGDYLLANDKIRTIIRAPGRDFSFILTYGGNIVDADLVRPAGAPGRDNFGSMSPLINISSTVNVQNIEIINDGSDGRPAVLRTTGVDDLLDAIDPANAVRGLGAGQVPISAQDRDIPVAITTEYALAPGDNTVRIETFIKNEGSETLKLYVGDFFNGSGELDSFGPSLGFGDAMLRLPMPYLAFSGVGDARGVSYGIIPEPLPGQPLIASAFGQSGVMVYVIGQSVLDVLLGQQPGPLEIAPHETGSFARSFVVGNGDVGSIADRYYEITGTDVGRIGGMVTAGGQPAAGAAISVVQRPGEFGAQFNVIDSFLSDAEGKYTGTLPPGDYLVMAKLKGYPYDSGTGVPTEFPITVAAGMETMQDFELPDTAQLRVTAVDGNDAPMPAKVSVIGVDPAPDPGNSQTVAILDLAGFVFGSDRDQQGNELFGLAGVYFVGPTGDSGDIPLPPGEYEVVVSRGPEYSIHRQRIVLTSGEETVVNARVVRVVDTSGFVSTDYHVHLINSPDAAVTRDKRILTMAAEGVDFFVASDHDFLTDLRPDIRRLGLESFVAADVSDEITTFNVGHFGAWPLTLDPESITGGAIDWGRSGVAPGMDYPSLGSYDLSPAELLALARSRLPGPGAGVIQVNHINSETLGYLHLLGIDTGVSPPRSFTDPSLVRLDPAIENLYDDNYDALELWIEAGRAQTELLLNANLGDWFNLLNQGRIKAATSDSDTHATAIIQAGGPRNFVASSTDLASEISTTELAANVTAGRLLGTNGPFLHFTVEGDGGATAGLALGQQTLVAAPSGHATVRLNIQSPEWAEFDTVEVFVNSVPVPVPDVNFHGVRVPRYEAEATFTLMAGADFQVRREVLDASEPSVARLEADLQLGLNLERDSWIVVLVKGTDGVSRPLWPMNPQDLQQDGNDTLDDLADGNLGEGGVPALAYSNPLYVDVDGNGVFDAPMTLP